MTKAIEFIKQHGISYFFTPQGTLEMHGTDRQIEAFADAIRKAALLEAAATFEASNLYDRIMMCDVQFKLRRMAEGEATNSVERVERKFKRGDMVTKKSGAEWRGYIVGEYSTDLTPEGYAVESSTHKGSVQIYPAAALELMSGTDRQVETFADAVRKAALLDAISDCEFERLAAEAEYGDDDLHAKTTAVRACNGCAQLIRDRIEMGK